MSETLTVREIHHLSIPELEELDRKVMQQIFAICYNSEVPCKFGIRLANLFSESRRLLFKLGIEQGKEIWRR